METGTSGSEGEVRSGNAHIDSNKSFPEGLSSVKNERRKHNPPKSSYNLLFEQ